MRSRLAVVALSFVLCALLGALPRASAEDAPSPTAKPPGVKTKPGCCCYKNPKMPDGWACTWGWLEDRCKSVAADLKKVRLTDGEYKWNEGRCPRSGEEE